MQTFQVINTLRLCYDITTYDFKPNPDLKFFVQARAMVKTAKWLGFTFDQIFELFNRTLLVKIGCFFPRRLFCSGKELTPEEANEKIPLQLKELGLFINPQLQ